MKDIHFAELNCNILIQDQTIYFSQTDIHSSAIDLLASGQHHFDNSYDYHFQVKLSDLLWKKAHRKKPENTEFGYIVDDNTKEITIPLGVKGKGSDFTVYPDKLTTRNRIRQNLQEQKNELRDLFKSSDSTHSRTDSVQYLPKFKWDDGESKVIKEKKDTENSNKKEDESDIKVQWEDE